MTLGRQLQTKPCSRCGEIKLRSEFSPNGRWLSGACKPCKAALTRRWYAETREARRAYERRRYPLRREERLAYMRGYYERTRDERAAYLRRWYEKNYPERKQQYRDAWQRYRARKVGATVEEVDRMVVFFRDAGICGICGDLVDPNDWHLDHIVALAAGGTHEYENVQVSHPFCNRSKGPR